MFTFLNISEVTTNYESFSRFKLNLKFYDWDIKWLRQAALIFRGILKMSNTKRWLKKFLKCTINKGAVCVILLVNSSNYYRQKIKKFLKNENFTNYQLIFLGILKFIDRSALFTNTEVIFSVKELTFQCCSNFYCR